MINQKKAAFHNLGCKVNAYETEAMQQMLEEDGYEIVPFAPGAEVYVINTCTVTNIADRKSRQMLHKAKKMNPDAVVVAVGCYVQAEGQELEKDPAIDLVIGNNRKKDIIQILNEYNAEKKQESYIEDIAKTDEFEMLSLEKTGEHTRAYIKIQDGCNQFCTYCIIPYARGRARSRKPGDVMQEVVRLAQQGYKEVVLTGIHLSSYGKDLDEGENLSALIREINKVDGIARIRLGSLEPRVITREFLAEVSGMEKFCPHFHLSLQSGSDSVLKRMNRHYTTGEYYQTCELIRAYFEKPAITTDVIAGFPGETEEEFAETKAFLDKVGFYEVHFFQYSRRKGTRAAEMKEQVPGNIKALRSRELSAQQKIRRESYIKSFLDQELEILIEEKKEINGNELYIGHTKEYVKAAVYTKKDLTNQIITGKSVKMLENQILYCEIIEENID